MVDSAVDFNLDIWKSACLVCEVMNGRRQVEMLCFVATGIVVINSLFAKCDVLKKLVELALLLRLIFLCMHDCRLETKISGSLLKFYVTDSGYSICC